MLSNCRYWRRLLRIPWTARRSNQSILKEINPEYSLEGLMLKLKLQYFGQLMWRTDSLEKILMLGKIEGGRRRGWQRMRWLDGITDSVSMSLSNLGRWWRTGKPGVLQSMGSQRVWHDLASEQQWKRGRWVVGRLLNWTGQSGKALQRSFLRRDLKEVRRAELWGDLGKNLPGRGNSLCKGPEAGVEEQGGLCGWSRVNSGERSRREGQRKSVGWDCVQPLETQRWHLKYYVLTPNKCGGQLVRTELAPCGCSPVPLISEGLGAPESSMGCIHHALSTSLQHTCCGQGHVPVSHRARAPWLCSVMAAGMKVYVWIYCGCILTLFPLSFLKIELYLIYNIVLVSGIQQSESVIHTYVCMYSFSDFFPL